MTITYKTDSLTKQDVNITFHDDGKIKYQHSHGFTLANAIKYTCEQMDWSIEQYYEGCENANTIKPR